MCVCVRGDKECPFSGVTKSGRVWRNGPESDARKGRKDVYLLGLSSPTKGQSAFQTKQKQTKIEAHKPSKTWPVERSSADNER